MGGPDATLNLWKQAFSAVRASGGYPGNAPFFSGYIEFGGVVVKFYSSVEITLYLLADFLLQYVTLFQSRDIVKNLVSL